MLHAVLIINKAGGLIYNKDFTLGINKLTSNEYLVLAGTFHGYFGLGVFFDVLVVFMPLLHKYHQFQILLELNYWNLILD